MQSGMPGTGWKLSDKWPTGGVLAPLNADNRCVLMIRSMTGDHAWTFVPGFSPDDDVFLGFQPIVCVSGSVSLGTPGGTPAGNALTHPVVHVVHACLI